MNTRKWGPEKTPYLHTFNAVTVITAHFGDIQHIIEYIIIVINTCSKFDIKAPDKYAECCAESVPS